MKTAAGRVFVKEITNPSSKMEGVIVPTTKEDAGQLWGIVLGVGPGETNIEVGDVGIWIKYGAIATKISPEETIYVCRALEVLVCGGKLNKYNKELKE
jgi:co-chaperonin GroES (HSP10)